MLNAGDRVAHWEYPNILGTVEDVFTDPDYWWTEDYQSQATVRLDDGKVKTFPVSDWVTPGDSLDVPISQFSTLDHA